MLRKLTPCILILLLLVTACGVNFDFQTVTPGPEVTDQITVPTPDMSQPVKVSLAFGAGTLKLSPGSSSLVSGTAIYNIPDFKPQVTVAGQNVQIKQGEYKIRGIPVWSKIVNKWDLELGSTPIDLGIDAGAYQAEYEFGGLALTNLTIKDGASEMKLAFSSPNLAEMGLLRYETGASSVSLTGLANANFSMLNLNCGAGNYTLDFSGVLKRNAGVSIDTGMSNLTLVIPASLPVQLTVAGGLSNISVPAGWVTAGKVYTQAGSGPGLTIVVNMGAGNLTVTGD